MRRIETAALATFGSVMGDKIVRSAAMARAVAVGFLCLGAAGILGMVAAPPVLASPAPNVATAVAIGGQQLANRIIAEIGGREHTAIGTDLEAMIVFTVSQGAYTTDVIEYALNRLALREPSEGAYQAAISGARKQLGAKDRRRRSRGTGAGLAPFGNFSAPGVLNYAGGGAGYTSK